MFKRMSVLRRRPGDDRPYFARHWRPHGSLVARLPGVLAYRQNYIDDVLFEHAGTGANLLQADGFVELFFHDPAAMQQAFTSPPSAALREDEPRFLGHSTGYHIAGDNTPSTVTHGGKLILTLSGAGSAGCVELLRPWLASRAGLVSMERDTVAETVTRSDMAPGLQRVDEFVHLFFTDAAAARACADGLRGALEKEAGEGLAASLFLVHAETVV